MTYHYPQLAAIEFFDRAEFPWLEGIEAATDAIRDEFLAVLAAEEGFTPYISYPDDVPQNQFAELNNSPRWSAFHLHKMGKLVAENAAKCPVTMKALAAAPQPDLPGRTPASMFSLLKPRTRIPPHTGVHQRPSRHACAADHPCGLRFPRGQRHATMGSGDGVGVRRYDRARSMEH